MTLNETGFQLLMGEITGAATFLLTAMSQTMAETLTFNQLRAINAGRCAIVNMGENTWTFLMAFYLVAKTFADADQMKLIRDYADEYYPWVCTCSTEAEEFSALLGGDAESAVIMSSCSEKAQKAAVEQTKDSFLTRNSKLSSTTLPVASTLTVPTLTSQT